MVETLLSKVSGIELNGSQISSSRRDYNTKSYTVRNDYDNDNCNCTPSGDCVCIDCNNCDD